MNSRRLILVTVALLILMGGAWLTGQFNRASSETPSALHQENLTLASDTADAYSATVLEVDSEKSSALYRVREQFVNVEFPVDAVGTTQEVAGVVAIDASGAVLTDRSTIRVNLATLRSDQARRDNFIKNNTLRTQEYPEAHFVPTEIRGLSTPLPTEGNVPITISGMLTIGT